MAVTTIALSAATRLATTCKIGSQTTIGAEHTRRAPEQRLEAEEDIEVVLLPLRGLLAHVQALVRERNVAVHSPVYTLAVGLEMASRLGNLGSPQAPARC